MAATTNFVRLAGSIGLAINVSGLPLVAIPHPLGDREQAAERARTVAAQVVAAITGDAKG